LQNTEAYMVGFFTSINFKLLKCLSPNIRCENIITYHNCSPFTKGIYNIEKHKLKDYCQRTDEFKYGVLFINT